MRISVVMPVHNEERYLPYSLRSLEKAPISEFIFVLDHSTDRSEEILRKFASKYPKCRILKKTKMRWLNPSAESYDYGAQHARGEVVYFIDADVAVDPAVFDEKNWKKGNALRFRYYHYNLYGNKLKYGYEKVLLRISEKLGLSTGHFATVISFNKAYWEKTRHETPPEDMEGFRKNLKFVIKHILLQEHKTVFANINTTNCLHLRPKTTKSQQTLRGIGRYLLNYPLWKVVLHSVLYFEVHTLIGFLQAKWGQYGDLRKLASQVSDD